MVEPFANDWMRNVIAGVRDSGSRRQADDRTEEFLREALFSVRPDEFRGLLRRIHEFPGFKLLLSCTDRTPLEQAVKQALCFADLVIVVPAPLYVSCASRESDRYAEFNYESIGRGGCWETPVGVLQNVSHLLCKSMDAFDAGAVTFLPMLDESLYPSDLNVSFSALPKPCSDSRGMFTREGVQLEAFFELCRERLTAEYLGAMHLNVQSFSRPVLGDFLVGRPMAQQPWSRSLTEIVLPDVSRFSIPDLLGFRRKAANTCAQFSTLIADLLKPQEGRPKKELVHASIASFSRQMKFTLQSNAPEHDALTKPNFVLGSGGRNGGVMQAVDYLVEGGQLGDLVRLLINGEGEPRLYIDGASVLAGILA